jgi:hypothetical protein
MSPKLLVQTWLYCIWVDIVHVDRDVSTWACTCRDGLIGDPDRHRRRPFSSSSYWFLHIHRLGSSTLLGILGLVALMALLTTPVAHLHANINGQRRGCLCRQYLQREQYCRPLEA